MRDAAVALLLMVAVPIGALARGQGPAAERRTTAPGVRRRVDPMTAPRPAAVAVRAEGAIVLDGRLDEPAWRRAPVLTDFVQQLPNTGMPATYRTEVRIL
ncbi:MAG: hypothetical protein ACK53A_08825 [Gemmatimonadota bacterium]|jgi:hypothetical protein